MRGPFIKVTVSLYGICVHEALALKDHNAKQESMKLERRNIDAKMGHMETKIKLKSTEESLKNEGIQIHSHHNTLIRVHKNGHCIVLLRTQKNQKWHSNVESSVYPM